MSREEIQSLMTRAKRSLRSAGNLLDDGVIAAFGQHLVKSGRFTAEHQQSLQAAFADRSEGEYAGAFPSREAVERRLEEAREFVEAVARFLSEGVERGEHQ